MRRIAMRRFRCGGDPTLFDDRGLAREPVDPLVDLPPVGRDLALFLLEPFELGAQGGDICWNRRS